MKPLTPEQRENKELIVEFILHPHMHKATAEHLAEEIVEALTTQEGEECPDCGGCGHLQQGAQIVDCHCLSKEEGEG